MSKLFNYAQDFLDDGGTELGYTHQDLPNLDDMSYILPNLDDMSYILQHSIKVWEYNGMSQEQYYAGGW